jgi:hypothetical protein
MSFWSGAGGFAEPFEAAILVLKMVALKGNFI